MEHKEIIISFDLDDNKVVNCKLEKGQTSDLTAALCWGGPTFTDAAINGMLRHYLECESREAFLAKFLLTVADFDNQLAAQMQESKDKN